jgi:RimJ/RimL family protein N-acetyltransferase
MKRVVYGEDARVTAFVEALLPDECFEGGTAIGLESDGELVAGVVFDQYTKASVSMHVAALEGRNWLTRDYLTCCFAYAFIQLGVNRVTGLVRMDNTQAQKFDEHLGFVREGVLRKACKDGTNIILYGMLRDECRFIRG